MSAQYLAIVFIVWAVAAIVGGIYEGSLVQDSNFNTLLQFNVLNFKEVDFLSLFTFSVPVPNLSFFGAIGSVGILNYSSWEGWAQFVRMFVLALSFPIFYNILRDFVQALMSRLSG